MLYLLTVYFKANSYDEEVFTFETEYLDSIYQLLGNNGHWFTDDRYNYIVYHRPKASFKDIEDSALYDVLFCK